MTHLKHTWLAVLLLAVPGALRAQGAEKVPVAVVDARGEPIPFAVVSIRSGKVHVADAKGIVRMPADNPDSLELHVRRIGYEESYGWVTPSADGRFVVELTQLTASLSAVTVTEEAPTSIDFNGTRRTNAESNAQLKPDIDAIITGASVMAIEIYPSSANAPPEIIPFNGNGSCGIVAIWTGARR